ncbi:MAG: SH3 domain-containing protein, partial [Woeseiaceae bacterium]
MRLIVLVFALLLSLVCVADVVVPIDKVESSVNVRSAPDAGSDIVGRLKQGDSLPLVGTEPGWHEVQLEGDRTGFISADWARVRVEAILEDATEEAAPAVTEEVAGEVAPIPVEEIVDEPAEEVLEEVVKEGELEGPVADVVEEEVAAVVETDVAVSVPALPEPTRTANIKGRENFLVKFR